MGKNEWDFGLVLSGDFLHLLWYRWPMLFNDLPIGAIKLVIFHGYVDLLACHGLLRDNRSRKLSGSTYLRQLIQTGIWRVSRNGGTPEMDGLYGKIPLKWMI